MNQIYGPDTGVFVKKVGFVRSFAQNNLERIFCFLLHNIRRKQFKPNRANVCACICLQFLFDSSRPILESY